MPQNVTPYDASKCKRQAIRQHKRKHKAVRYFLTRVLSYQCKRNKRGECFVTQTEIEFPVDSKLRDPLVRLLSNDTKARDGLHLSVHSVKRRLTRHSIAVNVYAAR